ncbi:MAG: hypothetical protein JWO89_1881 [Verrucomicrobiaceae bacterium]|nr:hypothetical protein [Verrucomicrobiaceae bacterium]
MIKKLTVTLVASAAIMTSAFAGTTGKDAKSVIAPPAPPECPEGISYSNFELDYVHTWGRKDDQNANGVNAEISYALTNNLFIHATGLQAWGDDVDYWGSNVGLGAHIPLTSRIDFVVEAGGAFSGVNNGGSNNGWFVQPHLRAKFGCIELRAGATCYDLGDGDNWEGFAGAYYEIAPHVDLALRGIFSRYAETVQVGVRYKF